MSPSQAHFGLPRTSPGSRLVGGDNSPDTASARWRLEPQELPRAHAARQAAPPAGLAAPAPPRRTVRRYGTSTAADTTVVQMPLATPAVAAQMFWVSTIFPEMRQISFFSS